ncbi:MAG: hypothetical protein J1E34_00640 [Oscillospiraceae bacterium]|nr:hypothetical protein [Oscillospiraceae bacterium]
MKKTLSVILAAVMIFMFVPYFAFAAVGTQEVTQAYLEENSYVLPSGSEYVAAEDISVPAGTTFYVSSNAKLFIPEEYSLSIYGNVVVLPQGELKIDGSVRNADKITGDGTYVARVVFPSLEKYGLNGKIEVSYAYSHTGSAYDNIIPGALTYYPIKAEGEAVYAPLNEYIFIIAHIIEPVVGIDKFDDALMTVRLNGVEIPYSQGDHHTLLTTSGDISYATWLNDDAFLSTFKIDLPVKEGATVIGREGEKSADGEIVYIKYGQPFSFRVEIEEEYSKAPVEVYIVRGYGWTNMDLDTILADLTPAKPDADGYYTIPEVMSDYTVFVLGLVSNETIDKVSGIFEQIRSIIEIIKKFTEKFLALFGVTLG